MVSFYDKPGFVSILTLDRLNLTQKAVDSVLENSIEDNIKLVLLDNGSARETLEYLGNLEKKYSGRVTVLKSSKNLGVAAGRNKIFNHILSEYGNKFKWVLSLDNDCMVHKGYDEAITNCIAETNSSVVCPRLIHPDGTILYNAHSGFLVDLEKRKLQLEYGESTGMRFDNPKVSKRLETEVILGTSAKTPAFFDSVGFYDEGHKIGWEDFSLSLKALGLKENFFLEAFEQKSKFNGGKIPLRKLISSRNTPLAKVVYEPDCIITHDHPVTEGYENYEAIRRKSAIINESTKHFKDVWGVHPVSRRD